MALKINKLRIIPKGNPFKVPFVENEDANPENNELAAIRDSFRKTPPLYHGEVMLMDFGITAKGGVRSKFILKEFNPTLRHPFCGLKFGPSSGHRLKLVVSYNDITKDYEDNTYDNETKVLYLGEGMLNYWDDNPRDGMVITTRFDMDETEVHPLSGLLSGSKAGSVLWLTCWALADDESAEAVEVAKKAARPWNSLDVTTQSNIKSTDKTFQQWIKEYYSFLLNSVAADSDDLSDIEDLKKLSGEVIRRYCGIESRREFKRDDEVGDYARQQWFAMMSMYEDWMRYGR